LEVVIYEPGGKAAGSAIVFVTKVWPSSAAGQFLEISFVGTNVHAMSNIIQQALPPTGLGCVHVCRTSSATCQFVTTWPGRVALHTDTTRTRPVHSLSEPWLPPATLAGAAVANAKRSAAAALASAQVPQAAAGGGTPAPLPPPAAAPPAAAPPADAGLVKKANELRTRLLAMKKDSLNTIAARAVGSIAKASEAKAAKKRKKKKSRRRAKKKAKKKAKRSKRNQADGGVVVDSSTSTSSSSSSDSDDSSESGSDVGGLKSSQLRGSGIASVSKSKPGYLLESGLSQIKRFLSQRNGGSPDEQQAMAANVVQYITSVWSGVHPTSEMGLRNAREMRTIGECLDALVSGDLLGVGDMLMQRLKAIEQSHKDGHWNTAQHLELCGDLDVGLAPREELQEAIRGRLTYDKLKGDVRRGAKKGQG